MSFWDSFTKSAADAAETTKLVTIRSAKQAEIMYIETQITHAMQLFGCESYPAMDVGDVERAQRCFAAAKRVVDAHRADVASKLREIDDINDRLARVGEENQTVNVRLERPMDVRPTSRGANSQSALNDL